MKPLRTYDPTSAEELYLQHQAKERDRSMTPDMNPSETRLRALLASARAHLELLANGLDLELMDWEPSEDKDGALLAIEAARLTIARIDRELEP